MKYNKIEAKPVKSGVILKDHYNLMFREHYWNQDEFVESKMIIGDKAVTKWKYPSDELISLTYTVVKVDEENAYYLKNKYGKNRDQYTTKTTLHEKMFNDYQNEVYPSISDSSLCYKMTADKIDLLIYGKKEKAITIDGKTTTIEERAGTIPSVNSIVDYPLHNEFLVDPFGQFLLNIGVSYETIESKQDNDKAKEILYMIYINLCGFVQPEDKTEEEMKDYLLDVVLLNKYTPDEIDFKFVVNWVAALIQCPGINLMTNLWFAGAYQGIGKGTLVSLIKAMLGENKTALLKPNMISGSFNGALDEKFLLEINEKQEGVNPNQMTNWLKSFSQEPLIQIEKKGMEPHTRINMINVIGTVQFPEDVFKIEDEDRRNTIYQTVDQETDPDLKARKRAKDIAVGLKDNTDWGKAFAWMLERVTIDWTLMSTARKTHSYNNIKTEQTQATNPLYFWAQAKFVEYAKLSVNNAFQIKAADLRDDYLESNGSYNVSQIRFNKLLKELRGTEGVQNFILNKPANILTAQFPKYKKPESDDNPKSDLFESSDTAEVLKNLRRGLSE